MGAQRKWLSLLGVVAATLFCLLAPVYASAQMGKLPLQIQLLPGSYNTELSRGKDNILYVQAVNTDNTDVANISLSSTQPEGWTVTFSPASIALLRAGSSQVVNVNIVPPSNAGRGNYTVTLFAMSGDIQSATSLFVSVQGTSPLWLWVGGGVGIVMVALFIIIFLRSAKQ